MVYEITIETTTRHGLDKLIYSMQYLLEICSHTETVHLALAAAITSWKHSLIL